MSNSDQSAPPLAVTSLGKLRGKVTKTRQHNDVSAFFNIPFAKPPVGELRFALPQPVLPWSGILNCSTSRAIECLQVFILIPESGIYLGREDCLYLNVFTPRLPGGPGPQAAFPVIVWFHGGAFCIGSNNSRMYGPQYLLDFGVLLVCANYRLGPFGFLSLECDEVPGNQGLHDQAEALRWVNKHIDRFGGDPDNVTIMGQSSGGMSCLLHMVSPISKGLFNKVIAMSASATTPFMHCDRAPSVYAKTLAKSIGIECDDSKENIARQLRAVSAKKIVSKASLFKDWDAAAPLPWKPIVDAFSSRPFLPLSFVDAVKAGNVCKVPVLTGLMSEDGLVLSAPFHKSEKKWKLLFKEWDKWAPLLFFGRETDMTIDADISAAAKIKNRYFPLTDDDPSTIPERSDENLKSLEEIFSMVVFGAPLYQDVILLKSLGIPVFTYKFSYCGSMTICEVHRLTIPKLILNFLGRYTGLGIYRKDLGACHTDNLLYIFPFKLLPKALKTPKDQSVSNTMLTYLTNFAKHANPSATSEGLTFWQEMGEGGWRVLQIDKNGETSMITDDTMEEKCIFFKKILHSVNSELRSRKPIPELHSVTAEKRSTG